MDTEEINDVLSRISYSGKEKIIKAFTQLIKYIVREGTALDNINGILNAYGVNFDIIEINKIISSKEDSITNIEAFSTELLHAVQSMENRIIFDNCTPTNILKRSQYSIFKDYDISSKFPMTIKQIILNLCRYYRSEIPVFYYYNGNINFCTESYISYDGFDTYDGFTSIWLNSTDAKKLLGLNWQNNIGTFLNIIAHKISTFNQIKFTVFPSPSFADTLHVRIE